MAFRPRFENPSRPRRARRHEHTALRTGRQWKPGHALDPVGHGHRRIERQLAEAITTANGDATPDTINFNLGVGGHQVIMLASQLPAITNTVTIDGTSQPGFAGSPLVEINAGGFSNNGLTLSGAGSIVKGLVINNAAEAIDIESNGVVIQGNYIGTDWTGTFAIPVQRGVYVGGFDDLIGGTLPGQGNLISGATGGDGLGSAPTGTAVPSSRGTRSERTRPVRRRSRTASASAAMATTVARRISSAGSRRGRGTSSRATSRSASARAATRSPRRSFGQHDRHRRHGNNGAAKRHRDLGVNLPDRWTARGGQPDLGEYRRRRQRLRQFRQQRRSGEPHWDRCQRDRRLTQREWNRKHGLLHDRRHDTRRRETSSRGTPTPPCCNWGTR